MGPGARRPHVDDGRDTRDRDRFRQASDHERDVDPRDEAGRQPDAFPAQRLKAGERVLHGIQSERQRCDAILAARVGDFNPLLQQRGTCDGDGNPWQDGPTPVRDLPEDRGIPHLCRDWPHESQRAGEHDANDETPPPKVIR